MKSAKLGRLAAEPGLQRGCGTDARISKWAVLCNSGRKIGLGFTVYCQLQAGGRRSISILQGVSGKLSEDSNSRDTPTSNPGRAKSLHNLISSATEIPHNSPLLFAPNADAVSPDVMRRAAHDIVTFGLPPALSPAEFHELLGDAFRRTPFVVEFVGFLEAEKSLRFGAVNDWIHQRFF